MGDRGRSQREVPAGKLKPPKHLSNKELEVWQELMETTAPGHFVMADIFLVGIFVRCHVLDQELFQMLAKKGSAIGGRISIHYDLYQKNLKQLMDLATKLRLTPNSRLQSSQVKIKVPPAESDGSSEREGLI